MTKPLIGCLALQGCVDRHRPHIEAAGADFTPVKTAADFAQVDAFILPGGESTTMLRLIKVFDLWEPLAGQFKVKPVWGICAGTILMAEKAIVNDNLSSRRSSANTETIKQEKTQKSFGLLPIEVLRNGYGTQLESHLVNIDGYDVSFIRAPVISKTADTVEIKASHQDTPVWVQGTGEQTRYIASTFHPELTFDFPSPMHRYFVNLVTQQTR
ncbi:MAG: pyridoxal 5'-phosphate synthase glutaminase subunit PdxT [Alphaproteobacteria bacterium]